MHQQLDILLSVIIASALAGIIGIERERAQKPAGFRTNMIVGGSSCLLVQLSVLISFMYNSSIPSEIIRTDPIRVVEAIVVGVSFIGGGTILKSPKDEKVRNLTTAATLLYSSGIGISVALEQYYLAIGLAILAVVINFLIGWIENKTF